MRFTVLGSGTSTGVPTVACECATCTSTDPRDKRLRTSLMVESDATRVIIDTSSDFRHQMLAHNVLEIDAVVYTHHHFDHIGGFDDLRPYAFRRRAAVPIYGMPETIDVLRSTFPYAFGLVESTGASIPNVDVHEITEEPFAVGNLELTPIPLRHGERMRVNGYRIGSFAYCTDTNHIPKSSLNLLRDLDVLIIDGLRWEPHPTHFTIEESLAIIDLLRPRRAYLTHLAHQVMHAVDSEKLPSGVELCYDGLTFTL
ncbi:MAG: MBL fold metallo-hydrolase [Candidatus Kapabacteria bacterium]|nr:MBL fold metallo-hydrolase [Candidatus Kapabacteria bacterium]